MADLPESTDVVLKKVQAVLYDRPLFFVATEAERGIGLENALSNYFVVGTTTDTVSRLLEANNKGKAIPVDGGSAKLAHSPEFISYVKSKTQKFLSRTNSCYIQFFKPTDSEVANLVAQAGVEVSILNNSPQLTREIENKIKQYQLLSESGLKDHLPPTEIKTLSQVDLDQNPSSTHLVIQLPFGHTGSSTYFITPDSKSLNNEALRDLKQKFPNRICKLSKHISGHPFTVNACNYQGKTFVGGLSYQYTGIPELTAVKAATVGNDWELPSLLLKPEQVKEVAELTRKVGHYLQQAKGYRGMFGLDLIVDFETGKIFLVEINPRQTASIAMHTKLQLEHDQVPLSLIHLCEFLGVRLDLDEINYSDRACAAIPAAQVFLRSQQSLNYSLPELPIKPGIYRQQSDNAGRELIAQGKGEDVIFIDSAQDRPLIRQGEAYSISDFNDEAFLLLMRDPGSQIRFNEELARIQIKRGLAQVIGGEVKLIPLVVDTFSKLNSVLQP